MQIFVTGATGVIGRQVVPLLVAGGHWVTAVGRTPEKRRALERAGARAINVDLFNRDAMRAALAGQQVVINLATHIPPTSQFFMPGAWHETNRLRREAAANLVEATGSRKTRPSAPQATTARCRPPKPRPNASTPTAVLALCCALLRSTAQTRRKRRT